MGLPTPTTPVIYPESDGLPMADNTLQFRWIQVLSANLDALFKPRDDVFVGGNLFWYPVENFPTIVQAPDVFVVMGRPPGYRGSYKQWEEGDVPMSVVFEIRSPNDSDALMASKLRFYDEHGVQEYYHYDPDSVRLEPYVRRGGDLGPVRLKARRHTSHLLGIHFELTATDMVVTYPDGTPFRSLAELSQVHEEAVRLRREAEERAGLASQRADEAEERADEAEERADEATRRAEAVATLAERIRDLALKVTRGNASLDDLAELQQLLGEQ